LNSRRDLYICSFLGNILPMPIKLQSVVNIWYNDSVIFNYIQRKYFEVMAAVRGGNLIIYD